MSDFKTIFAYSKEKIQQARDEVYQDKRKSKGQFSRNDSLTHEDHEMLVIAEKES
ncbi:MAG: hypothetical protein JSV88_12090 [Candidatus Aminicenantes bacterium]|nr:MAG: hypothetical protein JSV88_12090 [Candidatus Aminicenantes bacterium]